jgi:hypothetical protein
MTKQLTERQREKIREASAQIKECMQVIERINRILDDMEKSDPKPTSVTSG